MSASLFYRIAAVLLLLFAAAHTFGFSQSDPQWGVDALLSSMRTAHFDAMGSERTLWDFFLAAGYALGVLYVFLAILAWQLAALPAEALSRLRTSRWAFALSFAAISFLTWRYLFVMPFAFCAAITACLALAAWLPAKR